MNFSIQRLNKTVQFYHLVFSDKTNKRRASSRITANATIKFAKKDI